MKLAKTKHGFYTAEAIAERQMMKQLIRSLSGGGLL